MTEKQQNKKKLLSAILGFKNNNIFYNYHI